MAYGDSANWNGTVPPALSSYTLEWEVTWRGPSGPPKPLSCYVTFYGGEEARAVARDLAKAWGVQNPHARQALYVELDNAFQVRFEGGPHSMEFKCYKDTTPPTPPTAFTPVQYGQKVPIFAGWGLEVFKS